MSNGQLEPRPPFWKRAAKIIAAIVAVLVPVLLAAYEAQVIMSHVILPAFSNKEHAVASSILMGVVGALAVAIVLPIVRRVRESARREGATGVRRTWDEQLNEVRESARREGAAEVRRMWDEQLSDIKPLLEPVEKLGKRFEASHGGNRRTPLYESLRSNSAELLDQWYSLVISEKEKEEVRLAANALDCYLSELARLEQPGTKYTLLLANFEIYAFCVQSILKELIAFQPARDGTIYVSTILTMPLSRWYNLSTETNRTGGLCAFTRERWELYRKLAARLKTDPENPEHWIQCRRILTGFDRSEVADGLYVYVPSGGSPHQVLDARNIGAPTCMELLEEVSNKLRHGPPDHWVHLIAKHEGDGGTLCRNDHRGWKRLREEHFEPTYHNDVHSKERGVYAERKGMFCGYVAQPYPVSQYEDVFAVDLSNVGEGNFGIGYHRDDEGERNGIVFFNDAEVRVHLRHLNECWDLARKS
jgi:hypothetical protein